MTANILFPRDFDTSKIVVSKYQKQKDSASGNVRIKYAFEDSESTDRLIIQSARMRIPFGITNNEKYSKEGDQLKWDIRCSFDGEEKNKKIQKFRECIDKFDDFIIAEAIKNSEEWLNDDDADEKSIKKSYKSALKKFKPKKEKPEQVYSDTFKINIPWDYEKNAPSSSVEFYDDNGNETDWTNVTPGCEIIALFSISGIWCSPGINSFGVSTKLVQLQIFKPKKIKGFNIKYDVDCDSEKESEDELSEVENNDGEAE